MHICRFLPWRIPLVERNMNTTIPNAFQTVSTRRALDHPWCTSYKIARSKQGITASSSFTCLNTAIAELTTGSNTPLTDSNSLHITFNEVWSERKRETFSPNQSFSNEIPRLLGMPPSLQQWCHT